MECLDSHFISDSEFTQQTLRSPREGNDVSLELFREQYRAPWGQALSPQASPSVLRTPSSPKYLIDRVAELQSPGSSHSPRSLSNTMSPSMMSSITSLSSPESPYSPRGLDAKRKVCEQRIEWLDTQTNDIVAQIEKLSVYRASELAKFEEEVRTQLVEMEADLATKLYAVRVDRDLDMHELRMSEMDLCDELTELRLSVSHSVQELNATHAHLEHTGMLPAGFRSLCNKDSDISLDTGTPEEDFAEAAGNVQPLTALEETSLLMPEAEPMEERDPNVSEEEWQLLCARHLVAVREVQLEWLNLKLNRYKTEVQTAIHEAREEASKRIQSGRCNARELAKRAQTIHANDVFDSIESIEQLRRHIKLTSELLCELDRVKRSWEVAKLMSGHWSNSTSGFELMLSSWNGTTMAGSKSLEVQWRRTGAFCHDALGTEAESTFSPTHLATPRVYIRVLKSSVFKICEVQVTDIQLNGDMLSFVEIYPGGRAQWQLKVSTNQLSGTTTNIRGEQCSVHLRKYGADSRSTAPLVWFKQARPSTNLNPSWVH